MARGAGIGARGALGVALVALAATFAATPAAANAAPCKHATASPGSVSRPKFRAAVTCLVNKARTKKHVAKLRANSDLDDIAQEHANLMVGSKCFSHQCHGERSVKQRFEHSPYVNGASSFRFSEELGYETTPRRMVARLLGSASHRRVILSSAFKDIGVGAHRGAPVHGVTGRKFMTYTIDLGALRK